MKVLVGKGRIIEESRFEGVYSLHEDHENT
jgi:hypothetical protein